MRGGLATRPRIKARAAEALLVAAAVLGAAAFFSACATPSQARPPEAASPKAGAKRTEPRTAERRPSAPSRRMDDYLKNCLSEFSSRELPQGGRLVVRRIRGRRVAAAEVCLLGEPGSEGQAEAGIEALGLSLAAAGAAGQRPGALSARLRDAGASLELEALDRDALSLELVAPTEGFVESLAGLAAALARPAFTEGPGPSAADFAAARRSLEIAALKRESDPAWRAARSLDAGLGRAPSESPLGGLKSLFAIDAAKTVAHWEKRVRAERFLIVVVGDLDPEELAAALSPLFASMPGGQAEAPIAGEAARPVPQEGASPSGGPAPESLPAPLATPLATPLAAPKAASNTATPSSGPSYLAAAFPAPRASSAERAALALALSILEDSLQGELGGAGFEAGFNEAPSPSGYLAMRGSLNPAEARASAEAALARIAAGSEALLRGEAFEAAKSRALLRAYAEGDSAAALARRIALDLASGGDGLSYFRLGEAILAASPEEVSRAARERLSPASLVWALE